MRPHLSDLAAERARRHLAEFVPAAWPLAEPGSAFVAGIHTDLICAYLERVMHGDVRRLLINIPPRYGKTLLVSVLFPTWVWITRPQTRFLSASYGIDLAQRDAARMRRLVESSWYQANWPGRVRLADDQNAKARFENGHGGARVAASVGGAATGEGGDIILVDDPLKIEQSESPASRQAAVDWFDHTISTRLNDPQTGAIIIIGQRLHEADLFGHLLARGGWTHLCLPAEYDPVHPYLCPDDPRTQPSELLWPERWSTGQLDALKQGLGSYRSASMLQQQPAPAGGGIFRRDWWQYYHPTSPPLRFQRILQSWDLAFTNTPGSDYVVGQVWGIRGADRYLLRQTRGRLDFTQTLEAIRTQTRWVTDHYPTGRSHAILIERAANAHAVTTTLKHDIPGVILVAPEGDKINRAHAVTPQIEAGNVYLPGAPNSDHTGYDPAHTPRWVQDLIEETAAFPTARHDDQVDALTQALRRAQATSGRLHLSRPRGHITIPSTAYPHTVAQPWSGLGPGRDPRR